MPSPDVRKMDPDAKKEMRRVETKDAAAALVEDFTYFREVLAKPEQSPGELRRLSGTLRRILVDQAINMVGAPRTGVPSFQLPDNAPIYAALTKDNCQMFASLGVSAYGFYFHALSARAAGGIAPSDRCSPQRLFT